MRRSCGRWGKDGVTPCMDVVYQQPPKDTETERRGTVGRHIACGDGGEQAHLVAEPLGKALRLRLGRVGIGLSKEQGSRRLDEQGEGIRGEGKSQPLGLFMQRGRIWLRERTRDGGSALRA